MEPLYDYIHQFFNDQTRFEFPYDNKEIKQITDSNGIYVLFEKGEKYLGMDRIVRIGSHDGKDRLVKRLGNHFKSKNQRRSVFRKHIGRSFLNQSEDDYIDSWNKPFKSIDDKLKYKDLVDREYESKYEEMITDHIQSNMTFTLIPKIYNKEIRHRIESGLIASLNQSDSKSSSKSWIGNFHPDSRIRNSKLWNIEYLKDPPLTMDEFKLLIEEKT